MEHQHQEIMSMDISASLNYECLIGPTDSFSIYIIELNVYLV
jgi:hypothetical protein